jgi:hypothetical protein
MCSSSVHQRVVNYMDWELEARTWAEKSCFMASVWVRLVSLFALTSLSVTEPPQGGVHRPGSA